MSDCCSSTEGDKGHPKKRRCPVSGSECAEVSARTITQHIMSPWEWQPRCDHYFFCDDPECDIVYFGEDGSTILKSQVRTRVGAKDVSGEGLLCYCFGVSKSDFLCNQATKEYVLTQTKAGLCSCDSRNPSGRCCLKDFPKSTE